MSEVMRNPPLGSYYLALAGAVSGWSEISLHAWFLLPALLCGAGIYMLAREWCRSPLLAASWSVLTPVYLTSASTVMCDVLMLAFWTWAVALWVRGIGRANARICLGASVLMAACVLTKYNGIGVVVLAALYAALRLRTLKGWWSYLIVPVAALAGWLAFFSSRYGGGAFGAIAGFATAGGTQDARPFSQFLVTLSFAGGCFITVVWILPLLASRMMALIFAAVVAVAYALVRFAGTELSFARYLTFSGIEGQLVVSLSLGVLLLLLTYRILAAGRDAAAILSVLTVAGTLVFASFVTWSVSGRYLLPIVPFYGLLVARVVDCASPEHVFGKGSVQSLMVLTAGVISFLVAWSDASVAGAARSAASAIAADFTAANPGAEHPGAAGKTLWFQGHWGFQYYLEDLGGKPLDGRSLQMSDGDLLAVPFNNTNLFPISPWKADLVKGYERASFPWLSTLKRGTGAGFYSDVFGPLPYVFGSVAPDRYNVYRVLRVPAP
jgi:hypothetical protein